MRWQVLSFICLSLSVLLLCSSSLFTCLPPPIPRMTHVEPPQRGRQRSYTKTQKSLAPEVADVLWTPLLAGYSAILANIETSWDACFWTYLQGCFTRGQLGSQREPKGRWGGSKREDRQEGWMILITHGVRWTTSCFMMGKCRLTWDEKWQYLP